MHIRAALEAEFENGASVIGESKIFYCKKKEGCRITKVRLIPEHPRALPEAVEAIREADMILVLDNGQISAVGAHDELMETSKIYQEVFYSQQKGGLE